jgi:uncharacterized protein (DUF2249 family)
MSVTSELLVDVRPMPPRTRHATIFSTWQRLDDGQSMLLVNDHDPLPLYFQFACEHQGEFFWEYVESGPEVWQVRISKGRYENPGFIPKRKPAAACTTSAPITFVQPLVVDTRPIFGRGETPCGAIDEAMEKVIPGQALVLLVPFEPKPLYAKFGAQGFSHQATLEPDGTWRIEFRR